MTLSTVLENVIEKVTAVVQSQPLTGKRTSSFLAVFLSKHVNHGVMLEMLKEK